MTKDSAKALMDNPAIKLVAMVATVLISAGGGVWAVLSKIEDVNSNLEKVIAIQQGKDNVQDVRQSNTEHDLSSLKQDVKEINDWRISFSFAPQPAMKPKPIEVEAEP